MSNIINLFIVDDHPLIVKSYKGVVDDYKSREEFQFVYTEAINCKTGYEAITNAEVPFDMAFLDLNMPSYDEKEIYTGKSLAYYLKEKMPDCKILFMTMASDMSKIIEILDEIDPHGMAIKNDLDYRELMRGMDKILKGFKYYSKSVISLLSKPHPLRASIDQFDIELLHQMSLGIKPRYLSKYVPMTVDVTEKRRLRLYEDIFAPSGLQEDLIKQSRKIGLLPPLE